MRVLSLCVCRTLLAATPILVLLFFVCAMPALGIAATANPALKASFYPPGAQAPQSKTLDLQTLDLSVNIAGGAAETIATLRFENPTNVPLEGDFALDLPTGSVVTGYALDVGDNMVDGVLVGHRQAKLAYEAKVRRGADPGIAEVTRTNAFRTRVFPIFPGRGRTIRVSFVTPLASGAPFVLPLSSENPVGSISVHMTAADREAPNILAAPAGLNPSWTRTQSGYEARASAEMLVLAGEIKIEPAAKPEMVSLTRHRNGDTFFEINDLPPTVGAAFVRPKRVRVYWDHSLSRRHDDLAKETALLVRYLQTFSPGTVDLILFSDNGPEVRTYKGGSAANQVELALKRAEYSGASSVAGVLTGSFPMADACLYFSDGNVTLDAYSAERIRCPLTAISSAPDANRGFLTALAKHSAGIYLDLTAVTSEDAFARTTADAPRVTAVTATDGRNIDYASLPAEIGHLRIVGPVPDFGDIVVNFSNGKSKTYEVDRNHIRPHDAIGAFWSLAHTADLTATDRPDQDAVLALARRFSVTMPGTSFVVLETGEDYANDGIEPPSSIGEQGLARYRQARTQMDLRKKLDQATHLDKVIKEWTELKAWRQTDFSNALFPPPPPKFRGSAAGSVPPPGIPAPAPVAPRVSGSSEIPEQVLVTGSLIRGAAAVGVPVTTLAPGDSSPSDVTIAIEPWNPDRPYLTALKAASASTFDAVYRQQERDYGTLPVFYLDVAEFLFRRGEPQKALHVALNALDLSATDESTLMIIAERLIRYGAESRGIWLYERLIYLEPDLPQPRRDLALVLMARADRSTKHAAQRLDYSRALDLLNDVIMRTWSPAYDGIEAVSLMEANRIIPRLSRLGVSSVPLDPRLIAPIDADLRVVLEWNTNITDMDLWVDEPTGERAIYSHQRTRIGGRLSHDMTGGYGPEEYLLAHALPGTYTVRVNTFATDRLNPNGPITVRVHLFRGYNRTEEREQTFELEIERTHPQSGQDNHIVGTFTVTAGAKRVLF